MVVDPTWILSPSCKTALRMGFPFTRVPLALSRSSMCNSPPAWTLIRACRRETPVVLQAYRQQPAARPMMISDPIHAEHLPEAFAGQYDQMRAVAAGAERQLGDLADDGRIAFIVMAWW